MLKPFRLVIKQWSNSGSTANPGQPCASVATLCLRWNSGPSITSTASRGAKKHIKHHQNALKALKLQLPQNSLTFIWTTIHPNSNIPCASDAPNMLPAVAALAALAALAAALVAPIRKRFRIIQTDVILISIWSDRSKMVGSLCELLHFPWPGISLAVHAGSCPSEANSWLALISSRQFRKPL